MRVITYLIILAVGILIGMTIGLHFIADFVEMVMPYPVETEYVQVGATYE